MDASSSPGVLAAPERQTAKRPALASWPEWLTLALYIAMVAFAIPYHEPWADEAQAWELAKTLPLKTLFAHGLRYEGSPGLWHLLLWAMLRLHIGYTGMHWVCGGLAVAGAALLLFASPLPRQLKLGLPFTFFLAFQYAVVARSYVLVPLLLFALAACWKRGPLTVALLLGLLANVALHAAAIAGGFALFYCWDWLRDHREQLRDPRERVRALRPLLLGVLVMAAFCCFAVWTVWPPPDLLVPSFGANQHHFLQRGLRGRGSFAASWGLLQPRWLAIPFWIFIVLGLYKRRELQSLLPVCFFLAFSSAVYVNFWHCGLLVPLLAAVFWITWPRRSVTPQGWELGLRLSLFGLIVLQIAWSVFALAFDHRHAYSPDLAASRYLAPYVQAGDTLAVTSLTRNALGAYDSVGLAPYFSRNLFLNQAQPYWWWSQRDRTDASFGDALRRHPDLFVLEYHDAVPYSPARDLVGPKVAALARQGYGLAAVFCGRKPEHFGFEEYSCHLIYKRPAL